MKKLIALVVALVPLAAFAQHWVSPIRVAVAPPALRVEVRTMAPSPRHQWLGGYWAWRGGKHAWIGGHWALPPGANYVWEPAAWENQNGSWAFYEGHWRNTELPDQNVVYQPPPPPVEVDVAPGPPPAMIEEVRPPIPWAGAAWIPGYWHWNGGNHIWVGGRWSAQPRGYVWEEHRWDKRDDGKWEHHEGHWHPGWEHHDEHHEDHDRH